MNSHNFQFESKYVYIENTPIYYIDEGEGTPLLFLHGNPTSSYIWRNIIPFMTPHARCVAPDLPGMGKSGKPAINYRFKDHSHYIETFIEKLELKNFVLVLHDWGSAIGFHYLLNHPDNVKGIVFMEAIVHPWRMKNMKWNHRIGFNLLRAPLLGEVLIYVMNAFINIIMPALISGKLNSQDKKAYKTPYKKISARKPMLSMVRELPINGKPKDVYNIVVQYSRYLEKNNLPKLLIYGIPGAIIDKKTLFWCKKHFNNLTTVYVGKGYHFLQEDHPEKIGDQIAEWYKEQFITD